MIIKDILDSFSELSLLKGDILTEIKYIRSDSRQILTNDIFSISSALRDTAYFLDAKNRGSGIALISEDSPLIEEAGKYFSNIIVSSEPSEYIQGKIASFILGNPSSKLKVFAITGTNGKTSMTHILHHIATSLGFKAGLIGTLHAKYGDTVLETGYTTPDASTLQLILDKMVQENVEYVFMEASSHGLKLGRTNGLNIYAALFTNLTKDHMDFHPTMEDYLHSKFRLFTLLDESMHKNKFGVCVADDLGCKEMEELIQDHPVSRYVYYMGKNRDFEFTDPVLSINGSQFRFLCHKKDSTFTTSIRIETNLLGRFNVSNLALAISAWILEGIQVEKIPQLTKTVPKIPGRFDIYHSPDRSRISVVDYAHTPDALKNILESCKAMNPRQIICLFGCGGDRDRTKRPEMARIAEELSDFVIITSDNPRTEDPEKILDEIQIGFSVHFARYFRIQDRRKAIQKGIELLEEGGILAVCGKGHENYQIIGREKIHFDDGDEVKEAFLNLSE